MTLYEKIKDLLCQIEELKANPDPDKKLPQNSFYLNENDILCCEREKGESRYPYDADGLVVWAKSSGYIDACESTFSIFKTVNFAEDPSIGFFAGIIGAMIGCKFSLSLNKEVLKKYFGVFLIVIAILEIYSLIKEYTKKDKVNTKNIK